MTSQISHLKVVVVAASVQPKNCYDIGDSYCIISNDYFQFFSTFFINGPPPLATLSFIFSLFKQQCNFYSKYIVKMIHLVSGAGIRTHNLLIISLLP